MRKLYTKQFRLWVLFLLLGAGPVAWAQPTIQQVVTHQSRCPNTGTITVAATGSNLEYKVSGTDNATNKTVTFGPQSSNLFNTMNPGTYTVTVSNQVDGTATTRANVVVGGSYASLLFSATATNATCKAPNNGTITVNVNAGTGRAAYSYTLFDQNNNVLQNQASNVFTNLAPATYQVQVADSCTNVSRQNVTVDTKNYNSSIGGQLRSEGFTSCTVLSLAFYGDGSGITWEPPFTVTKVSGGGTLVTNPTILNELTGPNAKIAYDIAGADYFVNSPTSNTPRVRITDACGKSFEQDLYDSQTPTVIREADGSCDGIDITVRLPSSRLYNDGNLQLTVFDGSGNKVAGGSAPNSTSTGFYGEYRWNMSGLSGGSYTLHFTNGCQSADYPLTLGAISLDGVSASCSVSCTPGRTDVQLQPGTYGIMPAPPYTYTLTAGPAGQNYPLTYTSNAGGSYTIPALLPGSYTYTLTTKCGQVYNGKLNANCVDFTFTTNAEAQAICGNLRLASAYSPDANVPSAYMNRLLQLKDPSTGVFQTVNSTTVDYLGKTSVGTYTLRYSNLNTGTYREAFFYGPSNNQYCRSAYSPEVTLTSSAPTLDVSQAFNCNDNATGQVAAKASGGYPPYTYYLLNADAQDAQVSSNTTGVFSGLAKSVRYAIRVQDACNSARRDISLRPLSPSDVAVTRLNCDSTAMTLQSGQLYGATYVWTGPKNYSATDRTITLTGIDSTMIGTYTVTATLSNGCSSTSAQYVLKGGPCQAAPLPVTLVSFAAQRQPGGAVVLAWATASEINSLRFEIERSADGQQFAPVGQVTAAGNATAMHRYAFTNAGAPNGLLYYRLRQVDLNGSAHYSAVVVVPGSGTLAAYPNPWAGPALHLQLGTVPTGPITCTLHNAAGQRVLRTELPANTLELLAPGLPAGLYHLTVECNGAVLGSQRLVRE